MLRNEGKAFDIVRLPDEAAWLEARKLGIGGSDVAAIMGLSPWKAPIEVWMEKTGRMDAPDISGRESVQMGTELEADVIEMYKRRHPGSRTQRVNGMLISIERPWAQASLDAICYDMELGWGVLEIKTGSKESEWRDGVPLHYQTQVMHYLSVTGYAFADVAALIGDYGLHYHEYRITRDEEDLAAVNEDVDTFWQSFVLGNSIPPTITALPSEGKALYELYKHADEELAPDEADMADRLAERLRTNNKQSADLKDARQTITNELKRLIGEHKGVITDGYVVTWVRTEKRDMGLRVKERS